MELTREQQAEVTRNYQQQMMQQQQVMQMQAMAHQVAAYQQQHPGAVPAASPVTSDGEDWLMAGAVPQEAMPHKEPTPAPTVPDPMEPYREYAIKSYQGMVRDGKLPQQAVMEVLEAARATGNEQIMDAVLGATNRFPEEINTAQ
jgi:hypothetical protein